MKRFYYPLIAILAIGIAGFFYLNNKPSLENQRLAYEKYLLQHPFLNHPYNGTNVPKYDRPDLALEHDFLMTMNLELKRPTPEQLPYIHQYVAQFGSAKGVPSLQWTERGPNNVGGRTRAIMFDPNDATFKKVWAGGVGGGLWFTNDITADAPVWNKVNDFWDNIAISCIAFDPSNKNIFYVGTGEGWGNVDAINGGGIWKSTDGGVNFSRLSSTNNKDFTSVQKIVITPSGDVYAATSNRGVMRSQDQGASWQNVIGNTNFAADIELGADNTLYASIGKIYEQGTLYRSSTGNFGAWTKINNGTNGLPSSGIFRIDIACAANNANHLYVITSGGSVGSTLGNIYYSSNKGDTWTTCAKPNAADAGIPDNDFTRGQAWYDLTIAVDPTDFNKVIVGGVDLFYSTDKGVAWSQLGDWRGTQGTIPYIHADQHTIVFKPGSTSTVVFGNDGGVFFTENLNANPTFLREIVAKNNGYNVTQYYSCAMAGGSGVNYYLAGSQDNGTHKFTTAGINATTEVTGGDGAYCFVDQDNQQIQITSYVYNSYYLSTNGGTSFSGISGGGSNGMFINPADYDDKLNILYGCYSSSEIERISGIGGTISRGPIAISGLGAMASHLRVSPYSPTNKTTLFVGTQSGRVFKVENAQGTPSSTQITGNLPVGYISCIEVGKDENELLVTFSNYGMQSVWYTQNGGVSWTNVEGNLPDMPIRWALFKPDDRNQVMVATEVGVWYTTNIKAASVQWIPSNNGLANTRVDMLQIRNSDKQVAAATHGRGLFTSMSFANTKVEASFISNTTSGCPGLTVNFTDQSINNPLSWKWDFQGGNPSTSTDQNPSNIEYPTEGEYDVQLIVSNSTSADTFKFSKLIKVKFTSAETTLPLSETFSGSAIPANWEIVNPDNDTTWRINDDAGGYGKDNLSVVFPNSVKTEKGKIDDLILPALQVPSNGSTFIKFDYAHTSSISFTDTLILMYKSCNSGWKPLWKKGGKDLATAPSQSGYFIPDANEWRTDSVNISNLHTPYAIELKFQNKTGSGRNIYLDNINVYQRIVIKPEARFTASLNLLCEGNSIQYSDVSLNEPTTIVWYFEGGIPSTSSEKMPVVTYPDTGKFDVQLIATNEAGSDTVTISNYATILDNPDVNFNAPDTAYLENSKALVNFQNTTINGNVLLWDFGDGITSTEESPTHEYTQAGVYIVTLKASNIECEDSLQKQLVVELKSGLTTNQLNEVSIYPNPTNDWLKIEVSREFTTFDYQIFNTIGKLIQSGTSLQPQLNISTTSWAKGSYVIVVKTNRTEINKTIVKE